MRRIIRWITNNFPFKLVSVLIAIAIWYLVVLNNDPIETASYPVHVEVANESYIANGKQQYLIDEQYKTVSAYVTGNRSDLRNISADDIEVTADLTQIVDLDRDPVVVPLSISCKGFDDTAVRLSRTTIPIVIENVASKELPISVSTGDSTVDKAYEIGALIPNPSRVTIYGPESIINNIDSAVAMIDVTGLTKDKEVPGKLVFIDKEQNEISDSIIQDDITFENGDSNVTVQVILWRKQSDIGFDVNYVGEPSVGYQVSTVTTTPSDITIAGSDAALEALKENGNEIEIPAELIDVTGLFTDQQYEIFIPDILPDETKLSASQNDTVTVTVVVLPVGSIEYSLDVDDIEVDNLDSDLTVSYDKQEVILRIAGDDAALQKLTSSDIIASIDLKDKTVGDYTVPVHVVLPEDCTLLVQPKISIHIKEGAEKETETSS